MNETLTRVVAIHGNRLTVSVDAPSACGSCSSRKSCSGGSPMHEVEAPAELARRLRPGDTVMLALPNGVSMRAAAIAYLLPTAGFLFGMLVASSNGFGDGAALGAGAGGLVAGLLIARSVSHMMKRSLKPEVCGA